MAEFTEIKLNENMILKYSNGHLWNIVYPLDKIEIYIYLDGTKEFYKDGLKHRENGPAIVYACGAYSWWLNGRRHRDDGPAVECNDRSCEYWENGNFIRRVVNKL